MATVAEEQGHSTQRCFAATLEMARKSQIEHKTNQSRLLFCEHQRQRLIIRLDHYAERLSFVKSILRHGEAHHDRTLHLASGGNLCLRRYRRQSVFLQGGKGLEITVEIDRRSGDIA
jgi:hypothetical protein